METKNTSEKVLIMLLKEPFARHTATSLANALKITRQGLWKILNKLAKDNLITLESTGSTQKSAVNIKVRWANLVAQKILSILLTKESLEYERWGTNFAEFENYVSFVILFGSILYSPKEANDIDILTIVKNKRSFKKLDEVLLKIQKTQIKKIHFISLTEKEFREELKDKNKVYLEAIKKGVILLGQDNYIKFIRDLLK